MEGTLEEKNVSECNFSLTKNSNIIGYVLDKYYILLIKVVMVALQSILIESIFLSQILPVLSVQRIECIAPCR
jgi:hypothetical protein